MYRAIQLRRLGWVVKGTIHRTIGEIRSVGIRGDEIHWRTDSWIRKVEGFLGTGKIRALEIHLGTDRWVRVVEMFLMTAEIKAIEIFWRSYRCIRTAWVSLWTVWFRAIQICWRIVLAMNTVELLPGIFWITGGVKICLRTARGFKTVAVLLKKRWGIQTTNVDVVAVRIRSVEVILMTLWMIVDGHG